MIVNHSFVCFKTVLFCFYIYFGIRPYYCSTVLVTGTEIRISVTDAIELYCVMINLVTWAWSS